MTCDSRIKGVLLLFVPTLVITSSCSAALLKDCSQQAASTVGLNPDALHLSPGNVGSQTLSWMRARFWGAVMVLTASLTIALQYALSPKPSRH